MPDSQLDVDAIISTLNCQDNLERCLSRLKSQTYGGKIITYIVDGGSTDKTIEVAMKYTENVFMLKGRHPTGLDGQFQYGINLGKSPLVWLINSDNFLVEDTVARDLAEPLCVHPDISVSIPKVALDPRFRSSFNDWLMLLENHYIDSMIARGSVEGNYVIVDDINYGLPNAVMIRRETLNCVGGFDMDIRVLRRMRAMNKSKGAIVPNALIYHNSSVNILNHRRKLVKRLMFHSAMSNEQHSAYFVPNNEPESGLIYLDLVKSLISFTTVSSKMLIKSRDLRWGWGLVYPFLIGSVVVPHLADALHLIEKGYS